MAFNCPVVLTTFVTRSLVSKVEMTDTKTHTLTNTNLYVKYGVLKAFYKVPFIIFY